MSKLEKVKKDSKKVRRWSEITIAIGAIVAIFISSITLYIQRDHNILSLKPVLSMGTEDKPEYLRLYILNIGNGPLKNGIIRYTFNDSSDTDIIKILDYSRSVRPIQVKYHVDRKEYPKGSFSLGAGQKEEIYSIIPEKGESKFNNEEILQIKRLLNEINIYIEYEDIYSIYESFDAVTNFRFHDTSRY